MADIVNLKRVRKARRRAEKEAEAAANRVRYGRSGRETERQARERTMREKQLDGARLSDSGQPDEPGDPDGKVGRD